MVTTENELFKIATLLLIMDDVFHCYKTVEENPEARKCYYEFAAVFHQYSLRGEDKKEMIHEILKSDLVLDALPVAALNFQIEQRGREQFQLVCGALYSIIDLNKDFIADAAVKQYDPKIKQLEAVAVECRKEAQKATGFSRKKLNKELRQCMAIVATAKKKRQHDRGTSMTNCRNLLKHLKPFLFKGAMLDSFIEEVNKIA